MKSGFGYFLLGVIVASVGWLAALAVLDAQLFRTFLSFGGHS